ncbi:restriction endonuclease [Novosphingobium pituita]|uniref:Restriction endonuclease type IV Mrr domain-containing protein n=1 Tax=Novosphingobium pituita TaxID=3056842 RepID=A0ABQ6P3Q1_9SPHN|nr:restriction endonuclease [Novosphingobium sp. IK01]GMM59495.1 hypothetical protein NUTIK01_02720 [Novosphingobium sp. IK01]
MSITPSSLYRRCYVSGDDASAIAKLTDLARAHGLETASAADVSGGTSFTREVINLIDSVDFVIFVITDESRSGVAYELGLAQGRDKPAFVVFVGRQSLDLDNAYMVLVEDEAGIAGIAGDFDRFVRNAKRPDRSKRSTEPASIRSLDWARAELHSLRELKAPERYSRFEQLCAKLLRSAGAEVTEVGDSRDFGADLVVWFNEIAFEIGGPTLVECKFYGGGSGSVIKNSEATIRRIATAVERSDANLALLVYDHDRSTPPPSLYETPSVLSFAVEDVIQAAEQGTLEREILKRRERARFVRPEQ